MGTIALASASALYCSTEAAWGSTAGGNYKTARITAMDIKNRQTNVSSNELSTSGEPLTQTRVDVSAEGSVSFEATVADGVLEMFLASLFGNSWSTALAISADIDVSSAAGVVHWSATTGTFTSVNAGDWVKSANFALSANNGIFYVSSKVSDRSIIVENTAGVTETTATAVTVTGSRLVFGTTLTPLSMEQKVPSATALYEQAVGMVAHSISLELATGAIISGQAQFVGKTVKQSTSSMAGTPSAVDTGTITESVDHILGLYEGTMGTTETWKASRLSLSLNRPVTPLPALGYIGAVGVRVSRPVVTATLNIYVEHAGESAGVKDLIDDFIAGSVQNGFAVRIGSSSGTNYVFMFQSYGITAAGIPVGGNDSDLFLPLEIAAQLNSTTSTAFSVFKV